MASPGNDSAEQCARFVLDELITTEEQYVQDLSNGIERYSRIFKRLSTLPAGLVGRQHVLLANVAEIAALHRHRMLPLLQQHRQQLEQLFQRWDSLIEQEYFNCYVLFAAGQRESLQLYDENELFFKRLQIKMADPLGIRSFLLKPVQRVTKYPLLVGRFIQAFFENRQLISKRLFEVACRLENKLRELLERANQSDQLNDIRHFNASCLLSEAIFITVSELQLIDGRLRRCYKCKLFAFNTCLIYTERKGGKQLLRGTFVLPDVCFVAKAKSFMLCSKQSECEFLCSPAQLHRWEATVRHLLQQFLNGSVRTDGQQQLNNASSSGRLQVPQRRCVNRTVWYPMH